MKYTRKQFSLIKRRASEPRRFLQVITGPRQIGKTTLVRQVLQAVKTPNLYVTADSAPIPDRLWIEQQWQTARLKKKSANAKKFILVMDEAQKIKNWSEAVKAEWDKDTREGNNILVFLLGSSKLLLQQGLTESLTGRFEVVPMTHWTFLEMRDAFGVSEEQYAWFGGFPGAVELTRDEQRWKDYIRNSIIETTISKDILMLTRVDKPALLRNLFELGCAYSGEIVSLTKILGQLHDAGNTTTLSHYLRLLAEAGVMSGLEKYSGSAVRQRASIPKFQPHNPAFVSALSGAALKHVIDQPEKWGRIIESAIGSHLLIHCTGTDISLRYWREGESEVDFILERAGSLLGIEVKTGHAKKTGGALRFRERYPKAKFLLISNDGLSWKELLRISPAELFD